MTGGASNSAPTPATKARLGELGIAPFEYNDRTHTYFQAPGGQVFRLAPRAQSV